MKAPETPVKKTSLSLRSRLTLLVLLPLSVLTILAGFWRYQEALKTAENFYDRNLMAVTLAVARDVGVSEGDALSVATQALMRETSDGRVFYHVNGPDGSFLTGYAYPPPPPRGQKLVTDLPNYFFSTHRGEPVRAVQLKEKTEIEGFSGFSIVTVWQTTSARNDFARALALKSILAMIFLFITVVVLVWFAIRQGLKPLKELEEAVSLRSANDLRIIRRAVPDEISGIVGRLNSLFTQVSSNIKSRDELISNAAHQLRNPIAGILTLAEAADGAKSNEQRKARTSDLVTAAKHASNLTQKLLSYERIKANSGNLSKAVVDLNQLVERVCQSNANMVMKRGWDFSFHPAPSTPFVLCDALLISEAVKNLIDNAILHSGEDNNLVSLSVSQTGSKVKISVSDSGKGMTPAEFASAKERFVQLSPSGGSGLGLAIVNEIVQLHDGDLNASASADGTFSIEFILPLTQPTSA